MVENPAMTQTEHRILEAAKKEFITNGLDGTSMQQIADAAKINKSLLHYYFRTKENLFDAVFSFALKRFLPQIQDIISSKESLFVKLDKIISQYIDMLDQNPFIPLFVLHELKRNPQRPYDLLIESGLKPKLIFAHLVSEEDKKHIRQVDPVHLMVNVIALCIFPYAAEPLLRKILFDDDDQLIREFRKVRKSEISSFVVHAIQK